MSIEDLLKSLHQEYLSSLPEKILTIEAQIQKNDVHNLRESFHKLKGTGTTYGLPEVSAIGELVEEVCLTKPAMATLAALQAVEILRDIHRTRLKQQAYNYDSDPRLGDIRKLLQN